MRFRHRISGLVATLSCHLPVHTLHWLHPHSCGRILRYPDHHERSIEQYWFSISTSGFTGHVEHRWTVSIGFGFVLVSGQGWAGIQARDQAESGLSSDGVCDLYRNDDVL